MGRKSSLTDKQWEEVGKRLLEGKQSARAIAKEFGTSEASIRRKFPAQRKDVKDVANQILATEQAFKALPIASQIDAITLADQLRSISGHLASAANYGAATAHRLSMIANTQVEKVDSVEPEKSFKVLTGISALTKMANDSGDLGLKLLAANKDLAKMAADDAPIAPVSVVVQVEDASVPDPQAQ